MALLPSSQRVLALANQLIEAGDLAGAERALGSLMGANPDGHLLAAMGTVKLRQNQVRDAENLFARAVASAPKEPMHAVNLGRARAAMGQTEEAIAAYRTAIKLHPGLATAYFELAALQQRSGRLEEAESTYRKLLRETPDNSQAKLMLGWVLMEAGKPGDAEALLRRTLDTTPEAKTDTKIEANSNPRAGSIPPCPMSISSGPKSCRNCGAMMRRWRSSKPRWAVSRSIRFCTDPITICFTGWGAKMISSNPMTARPETASF
jgi:predicted Zn-dependent protease